MRQANNTVHMQTQNPWQHNTCSSTACPLQEGQRSAAQPEVTALRKTCSDLVGLCEGHWDGCLKKATEEEGEEKDVGVCK